MPRPNPGPKLRVNRHGIFEIRWTELGRSQKISTGTRDASEAKDALRAFLNNEQRLSTPGGYTVEDVWSIYWKEHVEQNVRDQVRLTHAWRQLSKDFAKRELRSLSASDFLAYADRREREGHTGATVRRELSALEAAINHLIRTKRVNNTDTPFIPKPKNSPPRDRWLTTAEVQSLLEAATARRKGDRLSRTERFVHIALRTGARKRSIETLTWAQVDLDRGLIDFNGGKLQSKKRRPTVPISDQLKPVLARAFVEAESGYVLDHPGSVRKGFETLLRTAKIEDCSPHVLRHTFATHAAMAGVSLVDIARVLGNTVAMVERVYSKWSPEYLRKAVNFAAA